MGFSKPFASGCGPESPHRILAPGGPQSWPPFGGLGSDPTVLRGEAGSPTLLNAAFTDCVGSGTEEGGSPSLSDWDGDSEGGTGWEWAVSVGCCGTSGGIAAGCRSSTPHLQPGGSWLRNRAAPVGLACFQLGPEFLIDLVISCPPAPPHPRGPLPAPDMVSCFQPAFPAPAPPLLIHQAASANNRTHRRAGLINCTEMMGASEGDNYAKQKCPFPSSLPPPSAPGHLSVCVCVRV